MLHRIYFYRPNEFDSVQFIGVCNSNCPFTEQNEFEKKIRDLCKAMDWNYKLVENIHCHSNEILNKFPYL